MQNCNIGNNNDCCGYEKSEGQDVPVVEVTKAIDCRPVRCTTRRTKCMVLNISIRSDIEHTYIRNVTNYKILVI